MNNLLNKYEALESALRYIDLDPNAVRVLSVSLCGAHYEVILRSDWMEYDCFVGCVSGNVAGLDYFPMSTPMSLTVSPAPSTSAQPKSSPRNTSSSFHPPFTAQSICQSAGALCIAIYAVCSFPSTIAVLP